MEQNAELSPNEVESMQGVDLAGAILNEANLPGALFNDQTLWLEGFDPLAAGAVDHQPIG